MKQKWEAKVSTSLERAQPEQIWPLFEDFFGLQKWFPGLPTCHGIEGVNGQPGCIRFCSGFGLKKQKDDINNADSNSSLSWSKERLVAVDRAQMTLTYEMVDSNIGFKSYVSTVKVVAGYDGGGGGTTSVEWWISLDPVVGLRLEDLVVKYEVGLKLMVKKMEDAIMDESC